MNLIQKNIWLSLKIYLIIALFTAIIGLIILLTQFERKVNGIYQETVVLNARQKALLDSQEVINRYRVLTQEAILDSVKRIDRRWQEMISEYANRDELLDSSGHVERGSKKPWEDDDYLYEREPTKRIAANDSNGSDKIAADEREILRLLGLEPDSLSHDTTSQKENRADRILLYRYPTMECPAAVAASDSFALLISLTERLLTKEVQIILGDTNNRGQIGLSLLRRESWKITAVINAPDFSIYKGSNISTFILPLKGDSQPAIFYLCANPILEQRKITKIYVSFWNEDGFLARSVREIVIENKNMKKKPDSTLALQALLSRSSSDIKSLVTQARRATIHGHQENPDLTVEYIQNKDVIMVNIHSKFFNFSSEEYAKPDGLSDFVQSYYHQFVQYERRDVSPVVPSEAIANVEKDQTLSLCRSFGRELYKRYAPPNLKAIFWKLVDKLGNDFQSIQFYSNDPLIPWALMRPYRGTEERDFLGMDFNVGLWPVDKSDEVDDKPPSVLLWKALAVVAPNYRDQLFLKNQENEIKVLQSFKNFIRFPGDYASVKALFSLPPQGIIHFCGHGQVIPSQFGHYEYQIVLEHGSLSVRIMQGFLPKKNIGQHPLVFFNACEVGQSNQIANFVEGWAPMLLEAGASGYIGGLWPISDQGAAEFAIDFYTNLSHGLQKGPIKVTEILQKTRRRFFETGDPTYLSYVYYGDSNLKLEMDAEKE